MQKAIRFDMDGVLVHSEPVILKSAIQGLKEFGVEAAAPDFLEFVGAGEDRFVGGVAEKHGVKYVPEMKRRVYEIYCSLVDSELILFDEVPETLLSLHESGYRIAIASSADRIKVDANIRAAGIPDDAVDAILSGEDIERKKPFPDIFLLASERLGVSPSYSVVVEDAVNGIHAATAAGMKSVGVTSYFPAGKLLSEGASAAVSQIRELPGILDQIFKA